MRKILFLTTRNIVTTCGELRLIKNRAKTLYEEYGYKTDFLALVTRKDKSKIESMGFDSSLKYFEYTIKNPLGYIKAKKALSKKFDRAKKKERTLIGGCGWIQTSES